MAHEIWDEPFNGGASLVGCSGMPMDKVSGAEPAAPEALQGAGGPP